MKLLVASVAVATALAGSVAVFAVGGCDAGQRLVGAGSAGGAASSSGSSSNAARLGEAIHDAAVHCVLDGPYRLRFTSNGADGWWLRFSVAKGALTLPEPIDMLGLPAGATNATLDLPNCSITVVAKTKQAGELELAIRLDPDTNTVNGVLARTDKYAVAGKTDKTVISGVRDAPRKRPPACIHEGIFDLHSSLKTKWRLTQGEPRSGLGCKDSEPITHARVRIEDLGGTLYIDEDSESQGQGFGRAKLVRTGDCTATVSLELQDFKFADATLTFAGDAISGIAPTSRWQFFEDGNLGENLWACTAKNVALEGKRIAD